MIRNITKGGCQKLLSGFCPLRDYPPYPLNGQSFCQKTLSGQGGTPPPSRAKSTKTFLKASLTVTDLLIQRQGIHQQSEGVRKEENGQVCICNSNSN